MRVKFTLKQMLIVLFMGLLPSALVTAQSCYTINPFTASQVNNACFDVEEGFACYANGSVDTTFLNNGIDSETTDSMMQRIGNQTPLVGFARSFSIESIRTHNANSFAKIETQANLPVQLPDSSTSIIVFGNANVTSRNSLHNYVLMLNQPMDVSYTNATLFTAPNSQYDVEPIALGTLQGTGILQADGITPDFQWVRVYYPHQTEYGTTRYSVWVRAEDVQFDGDKHQLPHMGHDSFSLMQNITLRTDDCASGIAVESPADAETTLIVNGVPIRLQGQMLITQVDATTLHIEVKLGSTAILWGNQTQRMVLMGGQQSIVPIR